MIPSFKNSLIFSSVSSFFVFPFLTIGIVFYYIFSGTSKSSLIFNSVSVSMDESGFSFSLKPNFFILMGIVFAISFIITFVVQKITNSK
ncbi:hypothetical protein SAMN04488168_1294 [Bacillus sp. 491mf]|uniref:hypothetical protein n=1 Tax=Bacillus TaxID=1386 RepID=UPI000552D152|nr:MULTISPECIES: hypothetical protein [unclassified Bacillus (in: firmicutes)]SFD27001.1 hypothetical protein SAMN04488168_1294 [Bacillus sp. 491mf]